MGVMLGVAGEYFLTEDQKQAKVQAAKQERQETRTQESKARREAAFVAPKVRGAAGGGVASRVAVQVMAAGCVDHTWRRHAGGRARWDGACLGCLQHDRASAELGLLQLWRKWQPVHAIPWCGGVGRQ